MTGNVKCKFGISAFFFHYSVVYACVHGSMVTLARGWCFLPWYVPGFICQQHYSERTFVKFLQAWVF